MVTKREHLMTQVLFSLVLGHNCLVQGYHEGQVLHREKRDKTQATCLDKYRAIPGHTMCLASVNQHPVSESDKKTIVNKHNEYRGAVKPEAANMLKMYYDNTLETEAQIWAENCKLTHEHSYQRFIPGKFPVGQNIATKKSAMTWDEVITLWNNEASKFTYGSKGNYLQDVGHYTQLVWATSSLVGCGMAKCGDTFYYVCNYGPSGNVQTIDKPYRQGVSCSSCSGKCKDKLCDCSGKVCYNGGIMDPSTCKCNCNTKLDIYKSSSYCKLECKKKGDNDLCGVPPFNKASCPTNIAAAVNCPSLCDICPYADENYEEGSVPLPSKSSSSTGLYSWISMVFMTSIITWSCSC